MSVLPHIKLASVREISGPLLFVETMPGASFGELVEITTSSGEERWGQIIDIGEDVTLIQVFEGTLDLDVRHTIIRHTGDPIRLRVSMDILGRTFDGRGNPRDGGPAVVPDDELDVHGKSINPFSRAHPSEFIQTGISVIDGMNTLLRGQKLPIFSGSGLPHRLLASQIVRQATVLGEAEAFTVILAAMGVTGDEAKFFRDEFERMGVMDRVVIFLNMAEDPALERILTPRLALTAAEYLAFEQDMHILVVLVDMTYYCEALREVSAARAEVPGRRGFPGYMYTDLASIYERAGRVHGGRGSITQMPILTMPEDDITHPIPDLTAYITEGQLVFDRDISRRGMYPPLNPLPSLSRLMDKGIGMGKTREDHKQLSDQLYYAYAEGRIVREAALISGEEALTERDRLYLKFVDRFEREFINQRPDENRDIEKTLEIGWDVLSVFPGSELSRVDPDMIKKYYRGPGSKA